MATPEARLRAQVLAAIRKDYPPSKGEVLVFGRPANASTGPGHPDLFGVALGHFLALELKFGEKSKPTDLQILRIKDLRRAGAYAWVVHTALAASKAVYQAKTGGRVPSTEDPIDFDAWFNKLTSEPAPEPQPGPVIDPTPVVPDWVEDAIAAEVQPDPVLAAAAAAGIDTAEKVEPSPLDLPVHNGTGPGPDAERTTALAESVDLLIRVIDKLDADLRTVGDRVTEVWEMCNRIEHVSRVSFNGYADVAQEVINMHVALDRILAELGEEPLPQPMAEPTPLDDVLPPEPVKVKRGRKPKAS